MKSILGALGILGIVAFAGSAVAAPFTNGDFEAGTTPPAGSFSTLGNGSTAITGWTVAGTPFGGAGSVDYINGYWADADPSAGDRSVDLSGNSAGGIFQSFDTVINQQYVVSFSLAGNPDDPSVKNLLAFTNNGGLTPFLGGGLFAFDSTGHSGGSTAAMGWTTFSYAFVATSISSTIQFFSLTNTAYGPALDNVSVSAVPIPAALPLFASGLAAFGVFARRRRKAVAAQA